MIEPLDRYTRAGLPEICGQQNVRDTAGDNVRQNIDVGLTPWPRIDIKIAEPAGNRIRSPGWKARILPTTS